MDFDLEACLSKLDRMINPDWVQAAEKRISCALNYEEVDYLPVSISFPSAPLLPMVPREYVWEKEKTLLYRLNSIRDGAVLGDDRLLMIGTLPDAALIPTMFDANLYIHKMEHWVKPVGDRKCIEKIIERGVPDVLDGWGWKVLKESEFFLEALGKYPNLRRSVKIAFADVQSPFDNACQVAGNDIFHWLLDAPELVKALVDLMAETQIAWYDMLKKYFDAAFREGRVTFSPVITANVHFVVDHCEMISPDMYHQFCRPSLEKILARFGNKGSVHFCGLNKQIQECIIDTPGIVSADIRYLKPGERDFDQRMQRLKKRKVGLWYTHSEPGVIKKGGPEGILTGMYQCSCAETLDKAKVLLQHAKGN